MNSYCADLHHRSSSSPFLFQDRLQCLRRKHDVSSPAKAPWNGTLLMSVMVRQTIAAWDKGNNLLEMEPLYG